MNHNQQIPCDRIIHQMHAAPPPPQVPNANLASPHEVNALHEGIVYRLLNKAQGGHPLRVYMFNTLGMNNFQNQEYASMLDGAVEYYACMRATQQIPNPIDVVAEDTVMVEVPAFLTAHPEAQQFIGQDQAAAQDLQRYYQKFQQIGQMVSQWYQQQQQMNTGGMSWQGNQGNQGGFPQGNMNQGYQNNPMGYPTQQPMNQQFPSGGHQQFQHGGMSQQRQRPRNGVNGRATNNADMLAANNRQNQHHQPMGNMRPSRYGPQRSQMDPDPNYRPNDNGATLDTSNVHATKGPRSRYVTRNQQNDNNHNEGDVNMETYDAATRDLATKQREIEADEALNNMPEPLELEYHSRLPAVGKDHVVITQGLQYIVVPKENAMDYADHEQDARMIELSKNKIVQPKVVQNESKWPLMSRPDKVDVGGEHPPIDEVESESIIFTGAVKASSISEAVSVCYIGMMDEFAGEDSVSDPEFFNDKIVEFYPFFTTHVVGATKDDMEMVERLRRSRNTRELIASVRDYATDMSSHVWYVLERRLTDVVNRRLKAYVRGAIAIDSVVDDYDDLLDALKSDYTHESIENFKQRLGVELKKACILRNQPVSENEELEDVQEFYTSAAVVQLPWTSQAIDLKLPNDGTPAMLSQSVTSEILTACLSVIKRTSHDSDHAASRRFMVTRDNVVVEIHEGDFGEASVLLSLFTGEHL